jgi:hypothetical protein
MVPPATQIAVQNILSLLPGTVWWYVVEDEHKKMTTEVSAMIPTPTSNSTSPN